MTHTIAHGPHIHLPHVPLAPLVAVAVAIAIAAVVLVLINQPGATGTSTGPAVTGAEAAPASGEKQDKQEELESFKNWMKNPGLGNMKG